MCALWEGIRVGRNVCVVQELQKLKHVVQYVLQSISLSHFLPSYSKWSLWSESCYCVVYNQEKQWERIAASLASCTLHESDTYFTHKCIHSYVHTSSHSKKILKRQGQFFWFCYMLKRIRISSIHFLILISFYIYILNVLKDSTFLFEATHLPGGQKYWNTWLKSAAQPCIFRLYLLLVCAPGFLPVTNTFVVENIEPTCRPESCLWEKRKPC